MKKKKTMIQVMLEKDFVCDFNKMSKKYGFEFIEYLAMTYSCIEEDGGMTEEEFVKYYDVPNKLLERFKNDDFDIRRFRTVWENS
jgi:hypothetical protein